MFLLENIHIRHVLQWSLKIYTTHTALKVYDFLLTYFSLGLTPIDTRYIRPVPCSEGCYSWPHKETQKNWHAFTNLRSTKGQSVPYGEILKQKRRILSSKIIIKTPYIIPNQSDLYIKFKFLFKMIHKKYINHCLYSELIPDHLAWRIETTIDKYFHIACGNKKIKCNNYLMNKR